MTKAINATQSALLSSSPLATHIRFPSSSRHRIIGARLLGSVKTKAAQMSKGISVRLPPWWSAMLTLMASLTVEASEIRMLHLLGICATSPPADYIDIGSQLWKACTTTI
jgi:hypothetical protein